MKKARLILTFKCHKNCEMCVNKHKSLIPLRRDINTFGELADYDEIILTGGEPMLDPDSLLAFIATIKSNLPKCKKIYLYTTMYHPWLEFMLPMLSGIHFTIHADADPNDARDLNRFQDLIREHEGSYRLYVEPTMQYNINIYPNLWSRIEIKAPLPDGECPLPEGEDLLVWRGEW